MIDKNIWINYMGNVPEKAFEERKEAEYDMFYLIACLLSDNEPDKRRIQKMNFQWLYHVANFHTLTAIVYMTLESVGAFTMNSTQMSNLENQKLVKKWKAEKEKAIRKTLLLDVERQNICDFMEQNGIWHMPLKGVILKDYYPKLGMRQMADNDILYHEVYQKELNEFMIFRGYKAISVGKGNHDVYEKPPIYNYEMHTALYGKDHQKEWGEYYKNVEEKMIWDTDLQYSYHFSDEDFYVYIVTHIYKHFKGAGTGIRSLIDIFVYLNMKNHNLDWAYIKGELTKLQIVQFEESIRMICQKVFSMDYENLKESELELLNIICNSGTYGTMKNRIEQELRVIQEDNGSIKKLTKCKYFYNRLFPDKEWYQKHEPFVYKHQWMIPLYIVYRFVRGLSRNGNHIIKELSLLRKI